MITKEQKIAARSIETCIEVFSGSACKIRPHFHLVGPSGSGKSYLMKTLAQKAGVHYFEINAAQLTKEGTSGNSLSKAMRPLLQSWHEPTVIFVDEFDKLLNQNGGTMAHTLGVQDEFLTVLEANEASVYTDYGKYQPVDARNTLFVFAGAYNNETGVDIPRLRELGLRTEFVGRVGLVFNTARVSLESMLDLIPKSELLDNYAVYYGLSAHARQRVIDSISTAMRKDYETTDVGIRYINTLLHQYFIKPG